jgi:tRNA U34 5-carboxymethylaminomethyl modifying GTPase MnmE/TrmE
MKLNLLLILVFFGLSTPIKAQDTKAQSDKIEALKVAFITTKLNISSAEAKIFWPVYDELNLEKKALSAKKKENIQAYKAKVAPSIQEANKFISDQLSFRQSFVDLKKKSVNEFKKVLPENKVALLLLIEEDFKQLLLQKFATDKEKK